MSRRSAWTQMQAHPNRDGSKLMQDPCKVDCLVRAAEQVERALGGSPGECRRAPSKRTHATELALLS